MPFLRLILSFSLSFFLSFFLSLTSFYLLILGVEVIVVPDHTQWHTLTRWNSPGRGIGPSQRPLPAQHTTFTRDRHPRFRRDSNPAILENYIKWHYGVFYCKIVPEGRHNMDRSCSEHVRDESYIQSVSIRRRELTNSLIYVYVWGYYWMRLKEQE
jgi:hypothetical protein